MNNHIHHVHIFASDLNRSIKFYEDSFDGKIVLDMELAGARNVFMIIGKGRIHFYDQPPRFSGRGSIHHFGIQTDNIEGVIKKLRFNGVVLKNFGNILWCRHRMTFSLNYLKLIRNRFHLNL
jgi:catechol 2,3-dioxygenase-like lactoylglutathione lyase family enzyme